MSTVTTELQCFLAGVWVNVLADVRAQDPIVCEYGIQGAEPTDRVASTGTLSFSLNNSVRNSGATLGYYSPLHASVRSSFTWNVGIRLLLTSGVNSRYKFRGKLAEIRPTAGLYDDRLTACVAVDLMDDWARLDLPDLAAQLSQRSDQLVTTILDALAAEDQPAARSIETGAETYPFALDGGATGARPTVREVVNQICLSEFGYAYLKGDGTQGGTFQFENRHHRAANPTVQFTLTAALFDRGGIVVPGSRDDIVRTVQVFIRPTKVDPAATTILYDLQTTHTLVQPGATNDTLFGPYRDPDTHEACGGTDLQALVSGTDYLMNAAQDGSGTNLTANFTVTPSFTGLGVRYTITNTGTVAGYVTRLRAVGKAIRRYDALIEVAVAGSFGARVLAYEMPFQSNTNVASDVATYLAQILSSPFAHVPSVRFLANKSDALMAAAILREPGDRIALSESVTGVDAEFTINSVRLELEPGGILWCTWGLEPASAQRYWLLGTVGAGELGETTWLGF